MDALIDIESVREIIENADVGDESPINVKRRVSKSKLAKKNPYAVEIQMASSPFMRPSPETARAQPTHRRNKSKVDPGTIS